jgi:hypothetical protein
MGRGKGSVETLFSCHSEILCGSYEGDPLSPHRGRQPKGSIPLIPLHFWNIIFNRIRGYRNIGDARAAGVEAR